MQTDLFGQTPLDYSIAQMRTFEPQEGYLLAFSGGKDSIAIKAVADLAGVKYDAHYRLTTVDPPEVVQFIKRVHPDVIIDRPEATMWRLIEQRGMLPTRRGRFCCAVLKERPAPGRIILTGVRSAESPRRAERKMVEVCQKDKTQLFVHAIKHWTDADIWDFIRERGLPYPKLYDEGWKRIGCVLCPFSRNVTREIERFPKIADAWRRAARRAFAVGRARKRELSHKFASGDEWFEWWLDRDASMPAIDDDQCSMFGEYGDEDESVDDGSPGNDHLQRLMAAPGGAEALEAADNIIRPQEDGK